ncbi:hypothetical protein, partial [Actinotalea sp. K2]|uniref:hypothetical protein n=1 Tax=Actinotalea sp. K2 TaxID=2939438 RepID=UPI0020182C44
MLQPLISQGDKHLVTIATKTGTLTATANHPVRVDGTGWKNAEVKRPRFDAASFLSWKDASHAEEDRSE